MVYCPNCGVDVTNYNPAAPSEPTEVVLARIDADARVQIARLEASARRAELATEEHVAEVQADAIVEATEAEAAGEVAAAEAVAEVLADDPEPEPLPEPVVVEAAPEEPENSPPVTEHHEPARKSRGYWDAYR